MFTRKLLFSILASVIAVVVALPTFADSRFVDLSPYANHDGVSGCTKSYINLPKSEIIFSVRNKTPFVINENQDGMIFTVLAGGYTYGFPREITITLQDYAAVVHFFGQMHWGVPNDLVIGRYVVNYEDGSSTEIELDTSPLRRTWNADDHCCNWREKDLYQSSLAWEDESQQEKRALIRELVWVNPTPRKLITSITFESYETSVNPVLCAITYERSLSLNGMIEGLYSFEVECRNVTSGQVVTIPSQIFRTWNCEEAGLRVSAGDRIRLLVKGRAN